MLGEGKLSQLVGCSSCSLICLVDGLIKKMVKNCCVVIPSPPFLIQGEFFDTLHYIYSLICSLKNTLFFYTPFTQPLISRLFGVITDPPIWCLSPFYVCLAASSQKPQSLYTVNYRIFTTSDPRVEASLWGGSEEPSTV